MKKEICAHCGEVRGASVHMLVDGTLAHLFELKKTRKEFAAEQIRTAKCANCGKEYEQGDLALLSDAICKHKPACSYECNKALGQLLRGQK